MFSYDKEEIARKSRMVNYVEACWPVTWLDFRISTNNNIITTSINGVVDVIVLPVYMQRSIPKQHHTIEVCVHSYNTDLPNDFLIKIRWTCMLSLQLALWFAHIQHSDLLKQCSMVHQSQLFKWEESYSFICLGSLSASCPYADEFSTKLWVLQNPNDNRWHFGYLSKATAKEKVSTYSGELIPYGERPIQTTTPLVSFTGSHHASLNHPPAAHPAQEKPLMTHASQS